MSEVLPTRAGKAVPEPPQPNWAKVSPELSVQDEKSRWPSRTGLFWR